MSPTEHFNTLGAIDFRGVPDGRGGFILTVRELGAGLGPNEVMGDLDGRTGLPVWGTLQFNRMILFPTTPAVDSAGNVYYWGASDTDAFSIGVPMKLVVRNGITGELVNSYPIPSSTLTEISGNSTGLPSVTTPVVGPDGTVSAGFSFFKDFVGNLTQTLSVIRVATDGSSTQLPLKTITGSLSSGPFAAPFSVTPTGPGGAALISWGTQMIADSESTQVNHIMNVSAGGGSKDFIFPNFMNEMVIGENGTAYATVGGSVQAFNMNTGASLWTYPSDAIVHATHDGLMISDPSSLKTVGLNGIATTTFAKPNILTPYRDGFWFGNANGSIRLGLRPPRHWCRLGLAVSFG